MAKRDIILMSSRDWDSLPLQSHFLGEGYAKLGHRVFFINQTLQKWPRFSHLMWRLRPKRSSGKISSYSSEHEIAGVVPITLWTGPPVRWLRWLNRVIIRFTFRNWKIDRPAFVTWVPTYTAQDLIRILRPEITGYVNYHHFEADDVLPSLLDSEKELVTKVDLLFTDSIFLKNRIARLSGGREVHRSMPGVYFERFRKAWRGDEFQKCHTIMYFGDIGPHLDLELYNALAEDFQVIFLGIVNPSAREVISPRIQLRPPVSIMDLPAALREADILTAFYRDTPYMKGVIPSKFFECMATGKPLLVSGLSEAEPYRHVVDIITGGVEEARQVINQLPKAETSTRRAQREQEALTADWQSRFEHFFNILTPGDRSEVL